MHHLSRRKPRAIAAGLAIAGCLGIGSLLSATPAVASSTSSVATHVKAADLALDGVTSSTVSGELNASLSGLAAQLGSAESIGGDLAVHADTPQLRTVAENALNLVAGEESKAETALNAVTSGLTGSARLGVEKTALEVTQGHELALNALAHLGTGANTSVNGSVTERAALSNRAAGLLTDLADGIAPTVLVCPLTGALPPVVSPAAAQEQAHFTAAVPLPLLSGVVDAGGWLLNTVTADEIVQILDHVQGVLGCGNNPPHGALSRDRGHEHAGLIGGIIGGITDSIGGVTSTITDGIGSVTGLVGPGGDGGLLSVLANLAL